MQTITGKFFNRTRATSMTTFGIIILVFDLIAVFFIYQNQIHNRVFSNPYLITIFVGIIGLALLLTGILNLLSNVDIAFICENDDLRIIIDKGGAKKTILDSIDEYDVFVIDETIPTVNLRVKSKGREIIFSEYLPYGYAPKERVTKISDQYWINYLSRESGTLLEFIGYLKKKHI